MSKLQGGKAKIFTTFISLTLQLVSLIKMLISPVDCLCTAVPNDVFVCCVWQPRSITHYWAQHFKFETGRSLFRCYHFRFSYLLMSANEHLSLQLCLHILRRYQAKWELHIYMFENIITKLNVQCDMLLLFGLHLVL